MKIQGAFAIVPVDIFDVGLKPGALAVFTALASFAGKNRVVWPSLRTLARMVGMQERSVRRHVAELEAAGVISRVTRFDESGRQVSNAYRLDILLSKLATRADSPVLPEGDSPVRGEADSPVRQTIPDGTVPKEHHANARVLARESDIQEEFDDWYQRYPRKVSRGAAERAFATARNSGVSLESLIKGVKHYAGQVAGQEARYIKHPATWLNGKCWLDEPEPPPKRELKWWEKRLEQERAREERERGEAHLENWGPSQLST